MIALLNTLSPPEVLYSVTVFDLRETPGSGHHTSSSSPNHYRYAIEQLVSPPITHEMDSDGELPGLKRRSSIFTETGLEGHDTILDEKIRLGRPQLPLKSEPASEEFHVVIEPTTPQDPALPTVTQTIPWSKMSLFQFLGLAAFVALAFPSFFGSGTNSNLMPAMAEAGPVGHRPEVVKEIAGKRQTTNTDVCKRWSGQSALVNGTLYYYGGRATTSPSQTTNEWSKSLHIRKAAC